MYRISIRRNFCAIILAVICIIGSIQAKAQNNPILRMNCPGAQNTFSGIKIETGEKGCTIGNIMIHDYCTVTYPQDHPAYDQWGSDFDTLNLAIDGVCNNDVYKHMSEEEQLTIALLVANVNRCSRMEAAYIATRQWTDARYYTYRELVNLNQIEAILKAAESEVNLEAMDSSAIENIVTLLGNMIGFGGKLYKISHALLSGADTELIREIAKDRASDYLKNRIIIDPMSDSVAQSISDKNKRLIIKHMPLNFNAHDCEKRP